MRYSSGVRFSRAKPTGSFRVLQPSTRRVASHDDTLKGARKSAAYWTSAVGSPMEIQERFPSGTWVTVETVQPKRAHATARKSIKPGDTVRVTVDTHGGFHPLVGERGYYADVVRDVQGDQVILTHVSWAPVSDVAPTTSPDALVTFRGRPAKIRMLDRGKIWWAMLPSALEPLATGRTYEDALRKAVTKLH
jgi:hypothetical protein